MIAAICSISGGSSWTHGPRSRQAIRRRLAATLLACDLRATVMPDKKLDEELLAMFENSRMEARQSYLTRGRAMQADDTEALISNWLVQVNAWADEKLNFERRLMDDIEAELNMRGIDAPLEQGRGAIEKIRAKARAVGDRWQSKPEELDYAEDLLQAELAKIRPPEIDKN